MYRLFNLSKTNLENLRLVVNTKFNFKEGSFGLCNNINNISHVYTKCQSTFPSVRHKKARKKRAKSNKKYAELLVVTNKSTSQRKVSVRTLTPNDLKIFTTTDFNLSEFYRLKSRQKHKHVKEHTYSNLTIIEHDPSNLEFTFDKTTDTSDILETNLNEVNKFDNTYKLGLENESDELGESEGVKPSSNFGIFQPETVEIDEREPIENDGTETGLQEAAQTIEQLHLKNKEEIVSKTLSAYFEVCSFLKSPQRGLNALIYHRALTQRSSRHPQLKHVSVYNELLKGFAMRADFEKVQEVLGYAKEDKIDLNVQSYVAIFECLGRVNFQDSYLKEIRIYAKQMFNKGYTFDKIMNEATFLHDTREMVLKAMQTYDPSYTMVLQKPSVQYNNILVNSLNNEKQLAPQTDIPIKVNGGQFEGGMLKILMQEQIDAEKRGCVTVKSVEAKPKPSADVMQFNKLVDEHTKMWDSVALEAYKRDLASLMSRRAILTLEPYLRLFPPKDYAQIIVDEAIKLASGSETYSPTVQQLCREIGTKVYEKYKVLLIQKGLVLDKVKNIHEEYCEQYARLHPELSILPTDIDYLNTRQRWQWIEHIHKSYGATISTDHQRWVPTILYRIGEFLYNIITNDLKVDRNVMNFNVQEKKYFKAFYTLPRTYGRSVKREIKPHPKLSELYRAAIPPSLTFSTNEVPMRCPPVPWSTVTTGGYLISPCDLIRLPWSAESQKQQILNAKPNSLYPAIDSLNQLAAVPWRVNNEILDIIVKVFNSGGSAKLNVPEPPSSLPMPEISKTSLNAEKEFGLEKLLYRRKKAEMYSLWCDCLYRLSLANHFSKDVFWLPHNMDFRGRVYPIPPHLNHLGSDLARSMLIFAEKRPLGPHGFDWLKIHLINLTGLMKREPIKKRLEFANTIMDDIVDSADKPLNGKMWWAKSEEPWQTLACCIEIAAAFRSPNPKEFRSGFPIHQDGSCNGLQHYAALGRDTAGAHSVNLRASSEPQDVYNAVVTLVEKQRAKDAAKGSDVAIALDGFIKRKVIKQTIMTTVYGVTRYGARLQIEKQLKDIDSFPKDQIWAASSYLTSQTFESLRTMFTSTRAIQDWFTRCARFISSVRERNVEWVTPLGLPVVQPYTRYRKFVQGPFCEAFLMDKYEKPDVRKQKNAFAPNFVHSLDSSHMMLTSLYCERAGIVFVSVHDCYWTHPSTVPIMNKICREQFVSLHSQPILEDLSLYFNEKYRYGINQFKNDGSVGDIQKQKLNRALMHLPRKGDFDITEVLNSTYFFS